MPKLFAVVVATVPEYYEYKKAHPEHDQNQLAWFREQQEKGTLLCCGPFFPHDGTGLWIIQAENLQEAQQRILQLNSQLEKLSYLDSLTGIPNRRMFDLTLEKEWGRALRNQTSLALIFIDLDCSLAFQR